mmetsp:Transcript_6349/g.16555  ORF Transcript_6349/g.16555 Transcript_6349/m.16555 type:complete len:494 (+) Transcript_6349:98-1579(+)
MGGSSEPGRWTNWAGSVSFTPDGGAREPTSEAEICAHVREAALRRVPVRVLGHGHSFNASMCAEGGIALSLRKYKRVLHVDAAARTVTCEAGITLVQLCEALEEAEPPLTLENVPVVIAITVAGALVTAAHGSGMRSQSISAHLLGCRLIDGRGEVVSVDRATNADLLPAARASLGVLGVISTVTLQCVPMRTLHISEGPMQLSECVERLDELAARFAYFKAWWVPHTGFVHAFCIDDKPAPPIAQIARQPLPADEGVTPVSGGGRLEAPLVSDATAMSLRSSFLASRAGGALMEGMLALAADQPAATPLVNCALRPLLYPTLVSEDSSYLVQCNEHRGLSESVGVRFDVSEFAIPAENCKAALTELVECLQREPGLYLSFPVDIRFSAADDIWLSPAYGRDTAWIGIPSKRPFGKETPHAAMFSRFEEIMQRHGGRPHWAKEHSVRAPQLRALYPRWADFLAVRARLDPDETFLNPYLRELLGVPAAARSRL